MTLFAVASFIRESSIPLLEYFHSQKSTLKFSQCIFNPHTCCAAFAARTCFTSSSRPVWMLCLILVFFFFFTFQFFRQPWGRCRASDPNCSHTSPTSFWETPWRRSTSSFTSYPKCMFTSLSHRRFSETLWVHTQDSSLVTHPQETAAAHLLTLSTLNWSCLGTV